LSSPQQHRHWTASAARLVLGLGMNLLLPIAWAGDRSAVLGCRQRCRPLGFERSHPRP
jgi:hypothetical protein